MEISNGKKNSFLSIELPHFYISQFSEKPDIIEKGLAASKIFLDPIVAILEKKKKNYSTVCLVDDYFVRKGQENEIEKFIQSYRNACEKLSIRLDYIVFEGQCSKSVKNFPPILPEPNQGAGSRGGPYTNQLSDNKDWLSNGDVFRDKYIDVNQGFGANFLSNELSDIKPHKEHALFLDVQLSKPGESKNLAYLNEEKLVYSCPFLAAWWQLIRLGMHSDEDGNFLIPENSWQRDGAHPMTAERTLTFVAPDFLPVEHAVNCILNNVIPSDKQLRHLNRTGKTENGKPTLSLANRLSYVIYDPNLFENLI